jgi:hypothetical protein
MSAEQFPITAAQLAGNFCETLFYGMYLVTCIFCARSLLFTGSGHEERWLRVDEIRWMMVVIASVLFVICTFDVAIGLLHNFRAFVQSDNAEKEFLNLGDWINITRVRITTTFHPSQFGSLKDNSPARKFYPCSSVTLSWYGPPRVKFRVSH